MVLRQTINSLACRDFVTQIKTAHHILGRKFLRQSLEAIYSLLLALNIH